MVWEFYVSQEGQVRMWWSLWHFGQCRAEGTDSSFVLLNYSGVLHTWLQAREVWDKV